MSPSQMGGTPPYPGKMPSAQRPLRLWRSLLLPERNHLFTGEQEGTGGIIQGVVLENRPRIMAGQLDPTKFSGRLQARQQTTPCVLRHWCKTGAVEQAGVHAIGEGEAKKSGAARFPRWK